MAAAKPLFFRASKEQPVAAEVKQDHVNAV